MLAENFADKDKLLSDVVHSECREYLKEAIDCFNVGAYRASLVMLSCAVFEDIRLKAIEYAPFDGWAEKVSKLVAAKLEKQGSWEQNVLDNVKSAKHMFKPNQSACLQKILDARNRAAHPSQIDTDEWEVQSLIRSGHEYFLADSALLGEKGVAVLLDQLANVELFPRFETNPRSELASRLLGSINPEAYVFLVDEVIKKLGEECGDRYRLNAIRFLRLMASQRHPATRKALRINLTAKRSLPPSENWLLDVICDDPQLLNDIPQDLRPTVDLVLTSMVSGVGEERDRVFFLADLFSAMATEIASETLVGQYGGTFSALLDRIWWHPTTATCLSVGDYLGRRIVNRISERLEEPAEAGHFADVIRYTRSEAVLAAGVTNLEALTFVAQICEAAPYDTKCASFRNSQFEDFPELRAKASAALTDNEEEAVSIVESYAPHADEAGWLDFLLKDELTPA